MSAYPEIKNFVQATLGCVCPEEVFDQIECQDGSGALWRKKINVGNRLLIYIVTANTESGIREIIEHALGQGVEERNARGLNRFRLVLVSHDPGELKHSAEQAFRHAQYADGKTHLHIVSERDIERL